MRRKKDEDKGREKEPTAVPSDQKGLPFPTGTCATCEAIIKGMEMERKPEWKTKEERILGCRITRQSPLSPTKRSHPSLPRERHIPKRQERRRSKPSPSCQKKPSFPTAENKNVSLSLLLKKANCRNPKRLPSLLPKSNASFSLLPKELPSLPQKKQRLSPYR